MSSFAKHPTLLAVAVAHGLLGLGHTTKGLEQFSHPSIDKLPVTLRGAVKAGWYEGSVFFLIAGLLNYKWSQSALALASGPDKAIAALLTALLFGAGANYYRTGDKPTGVLLAIVGALQGWGAKGAL
ncbi:hypothetical protein BU24DRAFT_397412 [Aaosphaeria arxii CBS 175.79]|uniref:Uncharacterized protein n=1 Tax=Aaosphaeria arxii CBS 175.79 TaxID=1450172 RepID=A0A6A5XHB3_9PLEO|nr:uncharacterized protein BU24DRAFT_397412 [Aaosphaeria arxii CBS 175.79]KAF2012343.1 hypothetical protein BU24DRAFT_397412 [Aaosphaeria arxii CBS 175.79]